MWYWYDSTLTEENAKDLQGLVLKVKEHSENMVGVGDDPSEYHEQLRKQTNISLNKLT